MPMMVALLFTSLSKPLQASGQIAPDEIDVNDAPVGRLVRGRRGVQNQRLHQECGTKGEGASYRCNFFLGLIDLFGSHAA